MTIFNSKALENEHILITGATGGIGYVTAQKAVELGATCTVTGRNEEKLQQLKAACIETNDKANVFVCPADIRKDESREMLVEAAENEAGPITGLVNSAGITGGDIVENVQAEDLRHVMELNYTATVLLTQLVYRSMKERKTGSIVNVSSLSGLRGTYGNTAYSASKFALIGFTQSFALEAIEHNIRVNAVCPGFVNTEMARDILERKAEKAGRSYDEQVKLVEDNLPSGRITTAEEVATSILFLLTTAAENIVGESMKISGGAVMR
ncbi:SDR family NAD(P)-dependent oxidoreductase [Salsuginibacillus kocurii]|uniref:SDR family NAD(P)-dependent oxidoreductase n=1 Tax=Salsuginibacillus kocurii TaxID=427078 RepID=UPI000375C442|nr:SDR family oxidoreductase [Salsuginibacillus kocurii]